MDEPGWSRVYETVKDVDVLICFALGFDSSEGNKSVVWVEPMLCVLGDPKFLENALIAIAETHTKEWSGNWQGGHDQRT